MHNIRLILLDIIWNSLSHLCWIQIELQFENYCYFGYVDCPIVSAYLAFFRIYYKWIWTELCAYVSPLSICVLPVQPVWLGGVWDCLLLDWRLMEWIPSPWSIHIEFLIVFLPCSFNSFNVAGWQVFCTVGRGHSVGKEGREWLSRGPVIDHLR